jgi:hypothetical protein
VAQWPASSSNSVITPPRTGSAGLQSDGSYNLQRLTGIVSGIMGAALLFLDLRRRRMR